MSFSRPFQWYHSHADPIWPDGTFKPSPLFQVERANCEGVILSFTAPGSSLDSDLPAAAFILKMAASAANLSDNAFDTDGSNEPITEEDLITGSLNPVPGGQTVRLGLSAARCPADQLFFFAMRAANAEGASSPVSNVVAGLPTCVQDAPSRGACVLSNRGGLALTTVLLLYTLSLIFNKYR
jgi:hypothetical protein